MSTVLAAIDNSTAARPVVQMARLMAELLGDECLAFHAHEDGMAEVMAAADAAGMQLETSESPPRRGIIEAAQAQGVSMLVLGARGTAAGRRPAGRTALAVVTQVRKPIVVVPPTPRRLPARIARILVPHDGTMPSTATLVNVITFARESDVEIVVLHVHGEDAIPPFEEQAHHEGDAWAREFVTRYCGCSLDDLRLEVRVGPPWQHVIEVARDFDADLIVLGWRRSLEPGHAAVVRAALAHSVVPVLLLPVSATPTGNRDRITASTRTA